MLCLRQESEKQQPQIRQIVTNRWLFCHLTGVNAFITGSAPLLECPKISCSRLYFLIILLPVIFTVTDWLKSTAFAFIPRPEDISPIYRTESKGIVWIMLDKCLEEHVITKYSNHKKSWSVWLHSYCNFQHPSHIKWIITLHLYNLKGAKYCFRAELY